MLSSKDSLKWLCILDELLATSESWRTMSVDDKVLLLKMYTAAHEQRMIFGCAIQAVKAQFANLMP